MQITKKRAFLFGVLTGVAATLGVGLWIENQRLNQERDRIAHRIEQQLREFQALPMNPQDK
jgi:hypothetical protein